MIYYFMIIDCYFSSRRQQQKENYIFWSKMKNPSVFHREIEHSFCLLFSNDKFFIICQIQSSSASFFIFNLNVDSTTLTHSHTEIFRNHCKQVVFIPLVTYFIYDIISICFSFSITNLLCYNYSKSNVEPWLSLHNLLLIIDIVQNWSSSIRRSKWTSGNWMAFSA